jgi:FkbM family methyltransferase
MARTERNNDDPKLTRLLVGRGTFVNDPMFVVDVGASGGLDSYWYEFRDQLEAIGFDPLVSEVERLDAGAERGVRYVAAWVTCRSPFAQRGLPSTHFFSRTSAARAAEIAGLDFSREHYNAGAAIVHASARIVLDEYFEAVDRTRIDFLKVDTDGGDYDVLRGADEILRSGRVLGLAVEAQFHGTVSADANLFANIDLYLRERGFSLFDLDVRRYSRAALPAAFEYEIPAQTITGQVSWADAIYFRDLGDPHYESTWGFEPTPIDIYKLIALFEIFGLADCSAELVLKYGEHLGEGRTRSMLLDVLAAEQTDGRETYDEVQRRFARDALSRFSSARS